MSLTTARAAFKNTLLQLAANTNQDVTPEQAIDNYLDALEDYIKSATVNVPGTGLTSPSGAVTGQAQGNLE